MTTKSYRSYQQIGFALLLSLGLMLTLAYLVRAQETASFASSGPVVSATAPPNIIQVNTDADSDTADAFCSLREAIIAANTDAPYNGCPTGAGADTITFAGDYTITLTAILPDITTEMIISGVGQAVTIDGDNKSIFSVLASGTLTISSLTVSNGDNPIGSVGDLTVLNSTIRDGTGEFSGIAMGSSGSLTVTNSTFDNNVGGIGAFYITTGTANISNTTFSGNSSLGKGAGAILMEVGDLTVTNSTFYSNTGLVGAIAVGDGTTTINNTTFSGNNNDVDYGTIWTNSAMVAINNSIITDSTNGDCYIDGSGSFSGSNNLIDDHAAGDCAGLSSAAVTNLAASPADNGGATHTMALLDGSNAIDAGDNATCAATDQRGITRPQGAQCDIGAYELEVAPLVVNSDADTDDGSCDLLGQGTGNQDCTLREAINAANANADGSMITFAANYTITLTSALPDITTILTIDGEGAANTIVQASACDPVTLPGGCTPAGWRVFTITSGTATLKDMTVRNGRSSGNGGGILVSPGSTVTIINSTLSSNAAANYGGGIENNGGLLTIYNSTLAGNAADTGGGIDNNAGTVTMDNNTLSANSATSDGGGIYNYGGPLTMTMGILDGNSATNGGGIYNTDSAILTINNSTFSGNPATSGGGGLYNNSSESVTISNSTFSDNSAANDGGGINSNNAGPLTINNSTLAGNWTMNRGGGIYNNSSNALTLNNSTFSGNWTTNYGGGIENDGGTVALINSTFSGNSAGTGGGLDNFGGTATLNNNTFSGNSATEGGGIYNDSGTVTIGNSIIANSTSGNDCGGPITSGGHNLDSDNTCSLNATGDIPGTNPLLDPLADNGGDTETHALQAGSAAIDAGDNATCTATDQRGLSRPAGLACDIGAYEYIPCFVERTGDNVTDFMSADASAVQDAINTASPDDTIKIAGTCAGVQQTGSFTQTVYINKNLTLQGGYDPDNWLASPDPNTYPTVLDAEDNGRVVYLANASQLTLAGLTLQNGHISSGNGGGLYVAASGMVTISQSHLYSNTATAAGGIYISPNSEVSLSDSTVNANESLATNADGGGIGNNNGTLNLMNVAMFDNEAGRQGGALSNNGQTTIINSDIYSNTAGTFGGAIVGNNQLTIENSRIANNWAENQGGAMHFSGVVTITHSLITGNSAADAGGISHFGGQMTIINTTISQNIARNAGTSIGGVRAWGGALTTTLTHTSIVSNTRSGVGRAAGTMTLTNSIIAYNGSSECSGTGITSGGYNLAEDSSCSFLTATGDITNTNPLLGPLADNGGPTLTHLPASGSEAIDAIPSGNCPFVTDQREVFRPQGTACDIGALEVVVVPGPPVLEIIQLSATDGHLIWLNPGIGCQTDVFEGTSPYFAAVSALENDATAPFPLVAKFGAVSPNYFYLLQMTCDGTLMESNRVGEFDFAIEAGN